MGVEKAVNENQTTLEYVVEKRRVEDRPKAVPTINNQSAVSKRMD